MWWTLIKCTSASDGDDFLLNSRLIEKNPRVGRLQSDEFDEFKKYNLFYIYFIFQLIHHHRRSLLLLLLLVGSLATHFLDFQPSTTQPPSPPRENNE